MLVMGNVSQCVCGVVELHYKKNIAKELITCRPQCGQIKLPAQLPHLLRPSHE